jgi:hypothetical protein
MPPHTAGDGVAVPFCCCRCAFTLCKCARASSQSPAPVAVGARDFATACGRGSHQSQQPAARCCVCRACGPDCPIARLFLYADNKQAGRRTCLLVLVRPRGNCRRFALLADSCSARRDCPLCWPLPSCAVRKARHNIHHTLPFGLCSIRLVCICGAIALGTRCCISTAGHLAFPANSWRSTRAGQARMYASALA